MLSVLRGAIQQVAQSADAPVVRQQTIFGLSPIAAALIAAALLLVTVLAIVAMTRPNDDDGFWQNR